MNNNKSNQNKSSQNRPSQPSFTPADFFLLRTPRFSTQQLELWQSTDRQKLREQLRVWLEKAETQEALYIASPALLEGVEYWYNNPDSKKGRKIELALAKYFIRMAGRPTPFGLFSGNSLGQVGEGTSLALSEQDPICRRSRLDMYYLTATQNRLREKNWLEKGLKLIANPTAYRIGEQIRYIETYEKNDDAHYRLSSVEVSPYVSAVLEHAKNAVASDKLADCLSSQHQAVSFDDAQDFIIQLVEAGLLLSELPLPLTGRSPDFALAGSLSKAKFETHAQVLNSTLGAIEAIDKRVVNSPQSYQDIAAKLKTLPVPLKENKLIQVDYFTKSDNLRLDKGLCDKVVEQVSLLNSVMAASENPLRDVIAKIETDFVGKMIPLQEFVDDESGWSMSNDTGFSTPLLKGVGLTTSSDAARLTAAMTPFEQKIVQRVAGANEAFQEEIRFSKADVKDCVINKQTLPDSLGVMLQLLNKSDNQTEVVYKGCYGPSAANLIGRFCHLNEDLEEKTKALLKLEESHNPDAIYAEIIHLPQHRLGNVIARPILREHELPIIGDAGVAKEWQIQLKDLYVYVGSKTLKLWSKRLNKEIIPRLSSAHNYSARSLGIYRFLCMLQEQNISLPRFGLPSALDSVNYVPRIKLADLVISPRKWRIKRAELETLVDKSKGIDTQALQQLQTKCHLPNWVSYSVADNTLLINLSNPIMLDILISETTGQERITLEEVMDFRYDSAATLDGAPLKHEVILPLIKSSEGVAAEKEKNEHRKRIIEQDTTRSFSPGSEWLSVKVYLGNSSAETLLKELIAPLVTELKHDGLINGFFFLRYGDPEWHLRLRFKGEPKVLLSQVLPKLHQLIEPIRLSGPVNNIVIDTYEQEVERYGGGAAIELAEQLFYANSLMTLDFIRAMEGQKDDYRWRAVLLGCDQLLSDFGFNLEQKLALISQLREGFGREFGDSGNLRKDLGKKYRQYQDTIASDLSLNTDDVVITHCKTQLAEYSQTVQQIASRYTELDEQEELTESLDSVVSSMLHMFNNRVFVAYGREQEFVVYDLLRRFYESAVHRSRRS